MLPARCHSRRKVEVWKHQIISLVNAGESAKSIAKTYNLSAYAVCRMVTTWRRESPELFDGW